MFDYSVILEKSLIEIRLCEQNFFKFCAAIDHITECSQHLLNLSFTKNNPISFEEAFKNSHEILI